LLANGVSDIIRGLQKDSQPPSEPVTSRHQGLELVVFWRDEIRTFSLPTRGQVSVGRSEDNQIRIEHPSVSRRHARLTLGNRLLIEDLSSANGTFVRDRVEPENLLQTHNMRRLTGACVELSIGESVLLGEITAVVRRAEPMPSQFADLGSTLSPAPGVVLADHAMREVYAQAERAAKASISVLILGETGVGKDLLARAIHVRSQRSAAPFMGINCAALS
jgi:two-component system response regulator AtoC